MQTRLFRSLLLACAAASVCTPPAFAQPTLSVSFGHFMLRHHRSAADIFRIEHHDLAIEAGDFNGLSLGGELLVPVPLRAALGTFEAGVGASYSSRTVAATHSRVFNPDGSPIHRTLGHSQLPLALTVRWLPLGHPYRVQPYAGGGLALIRFHVLESGDFAARGTLFRDERYETTRTAVGPVVVVGLRVVSDRLALGVEGRHQTARGSFAPVFARVRDAEIDLHGWTLNGTIGLRLGRRP
ncbi:MAG: hypothetical protein FJW14_12775 [Acidimicrobiia bacterium]|nr:hypothetical protein [Acidimicrobiia bacterium]